MKTFRYLISTFLLLSTLSLQAEHKNFTVDSTSVLRNPCTGWAIYIDGYIPESADTYYRQMEECGALKYATHFYMRLPWALLEPEEGRYAWECNPEFIKLIEGARSRNIRLAFRVYYDNKDYKIPVSPRYLIDAGAKGYESNTGFWTPYADDPVFLSKLDKFLEAMGKRFNDPAITDYIDGCGLGTWGEGFNAVCMDNKNTEYVYYTVSHSYETHFSKVICVINAHSYIGNDLLRRLADKEGFVFRHDAVGSKVWFEPSQSQLMLDYFPEQFTIAESMWWLSQGPDTDLYKNEEFRDWREVMDFTYNEAKRIHANTLDLRNVAEASTLWMKQAPDLVEDFNRQAGYRLAPLSAEYPTVFIPGNTAQITTVWTNMGWGVLPNKNAHWNNKYKVAYCLMKDGTDVPAQICVDYSSDPSDWLNGNNSTLVSEVSFDLPAGNYKLYAGIADTSRNNEAGIILSVKDRQIGGWVEVGDVKIAGRLESIMPYPNKAAYLDGCVPAASFELKFGKGTGKMEQNLYKDFVSHLSAISGGSKASTPLLIAVDSNLGPEAYRIEIVDGKVNVHASAYNGFLYAYQTLRQMLPAEIYGTKAAFDADWTLPCCMIEDVPMFSYRGASLDCVRHFFSIDEVKKYISAMSVCKMNRLHWHLTDDQGWRVQIEKYPLLTEVGAWRKGTQVGFEFTSCDGIKYGGFYTKEQLKDVVAFAKTQGVEIIPEIDLPGHMIAALSAYPWLGCKGSGYEVWTRWGVSTDILCPAKESTFTFLEDVFTEICEIFPFEMYHIGGDECPKTAWKECPHCQALIARLGYQDDEHASKEDYLQNYVTTRISEFLASKGKRIIGWDEILKCNPVKGTTIMHWSFNEDCTKAAKKGYDVVLCPADRFYLDYNQTHDLFNSPISITEGRPDRVVTFSHIYSFDPFEGLKPEYCKNVLGVQNNMWTEYIATPEHLEFMAMPRFFATSEVQWCPKENRDIDRAIMAVKTHEFKVLDNMGFVHCMEVH